jgi:hypothetical protein
MFNSPALDTAIGIVFIFLVYSLLVTSISEAIATVLALRARMLRKGIIDNMLSGTSKENRWVNIFKGIGEFFAEILRFFSGNPNAYNQKKLGARFYDHPMIKNYGSSRIFPVPSYLPKSNFSMVLVDLLESYFDRHIEKIKQGLPNTTLNLELPRLSKIYYLVEYLLDKPENIVVLEQDLGVIIDRDTLEILQLHLKNSANQLDIFIQRIENWFDDSMNRVSGWYKRQTQIILFGIGFVLAMGFNIDIVEITGKLSTDKDARDQFVALAIKASDTYKDDPHTKKPQVVADTIASQKTLDSIHTGFNKNLSEARHILKTDINEANTIMALGWGNYGGARTGWDKIAYIFRNFCEGTRPVGYVLFAFGICLGAPFWFDLLQKMIRIRASGKKEEPQSTTDANRILL